MEIREEQTYSDISKLIWASGLFFGEVFGTIVHLLLLDLTRPDGIIPFNVGNTGFPEP